MLHMKILVLLLSFLVSVKCIDPIVQITESDPPLAYGTTIIAERDRDVTMSCYVENLPADTYVVWQKTYRQGSSSQTLLVSSDQAVQDNISYGIEKPTLFTWRLRIRSVALNDAGNYSCYVQVTQQIKTHTNRTLVVYVKPSLEQALTSTDVSYRENDEVELRCNATGFPTPSIQWERQGKALLPGGMEKFNGPILYIPSIQPQHRGKYKCITSNAIGVDIREILVDVKFAPIITPVHDHLKQKEGYVIELQCIVEANPDPDTSELKWYQGNNAISVSTDRHEVRVIRGAFNRLIYELIINGVRKSDYGEYKCQVTNDIDTTSAKIRLSKSNKPENSVKFGRPLAGSGAICACLPVVIATLLAAFTLQTMS